MRKNLWLVLFAALFLAAPGLSSPARAEPEIGQPAPKLVLNLLSGKPYDLEKSRGRVVVIHFWATWCPSCREEMEFLDTFNKSYHDRGVDIIAISVDKSSKVDEMLKIMAPMSFWGAMIQDVSDNGFGKPKLVPVTYLIDKQGIVRDRLTPEDDIPMAKILAGKVEVLLNSP